MIFAAVASILFGISLLIAPLVGALVLTWWIAAYALIFGVTMLILAFRLRAKFEHLKAALPKAIHT